MTDERKNIFIDTVEELFKAYPMSVPSEAFDFFEDYKKGKSVSKPFTDKGIAVLKVLREIDDWITAKSLGEQMDVSGRSVSSTMRKLVVDGYVEKRAGNPASYRITEAGKTCDFDINIEEN
jgi:DNA-binding MarR family transcriptional regulator